MTPRELAQAATAYRREHPANALDRALDIVAGWDERTWWVGTTPNEIRRHQVAVYRSLQLGGELGEPEALERLARISMLGPTVVRKLRILLYHE